MTIQDVKTWNTNIADAETKRGELNSFALCQAVMVLCEKLSDIGVVELKWHSTVQSYGAAVANSSKRVVGEYFREDLNTLPPSRFFGLTGHDDTGRATCTVAGRYDDVGGWDLQEYIQRFWSRNYLAEDGQHARLHPDAVQFAKGLTGPFAYLGDLAIDKSLSGNDLAAYFVRVSLLLCYLQWRPAYIYAWMAPHHVAKGLAFRWGFPITWPGGFMWEVPPANKAYSNLCFVGCPPVAVATIVHRPLDIGALTDQGNNKG